MSKRNDARPVVGLTACRRDIEGYPFHAVADRYVQAVVRFGCVPLLLPAVADGQDLGAVIGALDGLLVTGSPSNIEPRHYAGPASLAGTRHDPARDATTLPLLRAAIDAGLPLLGICRGMQELNVALGGTLHQNLHELPGRRDHRAAVDRPAEIRYGPAHAVALTSGGFLAGLTDTLDHTVNSVHAQGVDRLAAGLAIEATADDGVIEAVRVVGAAAFALGIQWHPEYRVAENPLSAAIFASFAAACRTRMHVSPI